MKTNNVFNLKKSFHRLILLLMLALLGSACGGGDTATPPPLPAPAPTTGTISGSVSGTVIIAVNDAGNVVASDDTTGKLANADGNYPFTLNDIPIGTNIRVYLITGSGVYPIYFASPSTNVFSLSTVATIDLGFVDTAGGSGQAIPANDPTVVAGVSPQSENTAIPANASLIGTWGFSRLTHRNSGTWAAKSGKTTNNADGT